MKFGAGYYRRGGFRFQCSQVCGNLSLPIRTRTTAWKDEEDMRFLFLILAFVLFIIWVVSWLAFHIAGGLIHLVLVVGVILLIVHFFRGKSAP